LPVFVIVVPLIVCDPNGCAPKFTVPGLLAPLVDLAFAHEEARVQPAPLLGVRRQLDAGEDRADMRRRLLLDALVVDGEQDLLTVPRRDRTAQVRRPDAVLAAAGEVRPGHLALELAADRPVALAEAETLLAPYGRCQLAAP
jgi:hypothetical protein